MFKRLIACVFLLLLVGNAHATGRDYIIERAYFEDRSNALTLDQVKTKPVIKYDSMLSKGYSRSTFWMRLKVAPVDQAFKVSEYGRQLMVRIMPIYLDEIQIYDPLDKSGKARLVGDRQDFSQSEHQSLSYNFLIPASDQPRYVWLRLKTASTNWLHVQVLEVQDAFNHDQLYEFLTVLLFATLTMLLIWAALQWIATRERIIGAFILRQAVFIFFFASYAGYFRLFLSGAFAPASLDMTLSVLILLATFTGVYFHAEFFRDYQISNWAKWPFKTMLLLFPAEVFLLGVGHLSLALQINMLVVLLLPLYMMILVLFAIPWQKLSDNVMVMPRWLLILFHVVFLFIGALVALPSLGLMQGNEMATQSVLLHGFVTGVILMSMLIYRSKRMYQRQVVDIAIASQNAKNEKIKREEDQRFMEMLSHEFKNSLAILRMAVGSGDETTKKTRYADQAIESMDEVLNRLGLVQGMEDKQIKIMQQQFALLPLLENAVAGSKSPERLLVSCDAGIKIDSDPQLLKIMVANLMDNAIKYGEPKAIIKVAVLPSAKIGFVDLQVTNLPGKGGMPDANMVFKKYYRASWAHEKMGSGLGLYLIKQFSSMLDIELSYEPTATQVIFKLCLKQSA